jgi:colanic acid biosynthesis glycosyl transferase WcaI
MKIFIQTLNYKPDLTGIGKYSGEMADWLAFNGYEVRVVTATPYYPDWKHNNEYRKYFWDFEIYRNIKIWRCPIYVSSNPTVLNRTIHLLSFAMSSLPILIYNISWRPNIIITIEPPLVCAPAAAIVSWIVGAKSILHIQDYEIDAAFTLKFIKGKLLKKIALFIERKILLSFNVISSISNAMLNQAYVKGVPKSKLFLLPNWIDLHQYSKKIVNSFDIKNSYISNIRESLIIPNKSFIALYSGSIGLKQGINILADIAKIFYHKRDLNFNLNFIKLRVIKAIF